VLLHQLHLTDFRSYAQLDVELPDGLTVLTGPNGVGKTNVLEAIGYLATLSSLRGAPNEAMVRTGAEQAVLRAECSDGERRVQIDAVLAAKGRGRVRVNGQALARTRDLLGVFRVSVFAPDDLVLVKGGPAERRALLDDALSSLHARHDKQRGEVDRILRQRNTLLRQAGGRLDDDAQRTLDVWDAKLAAVGTAHAEARAKLLVELEPHAQAALQRVAGADASLGLSYQRSWSGDLLEALTSGRAEDLRRGSTQIGPHRDDVEVVLDGLPARTQASQGEQRAIALALRLGVHAVVTERTGSAPVLLLDDVFSELDPDRSRRLVDALPTGQAVLTCADTEPPGIEPTLRLRVADGTLRADG
jgi:DNA replication and repair protein RecF